MNATTYNDISEQIYTLSFDERIKLLELLVGTLQTSEKATVSKNAEDFDKAFGMWSKKDVSIESIREKAWGRSV